MTSFKHTLSSRRFNQRSLEGQSSQEETGFRRTVAAHGPNLTRISIPVSSFTTFNFQTILFLNYADLICASVLSIILDNYFQKDHSLTGNVHSGALPPWLQAEHCQTTLPSTSKPIGPTAEEFAKHCNY